MDRASPIEALLLIENAGQWAKMVGRELQTIAPGAIQGALTGLVTGGPAGAAMGAVAGGVGARLGSTARAPGQPANLAGSPVAGSVANPAALQLLAALLRPEVIQALGAMSLGAAGVAHVPVAGQQVPVAAFANLLSTIAGQAAFAHHATTAPASPARYGAGSQASSPQVRAESLLRLLAEAEAWDASNETDADTDADAEDDADGEVDHWAEEADLADIDRLEAE